MTAYRDMSREELLELKSRLEKEFEDVKGQDAIVKTLKNQIKAAWSYSLE